MTRIFTIAIALLIAALLSIAGQTITNPLPVTSGTTSQFVMFADSYYVAWDGVHHGVSSGDTLTWANDTTFDSTMFERIVPYSSGAFDSTRDTTYHVDTNVTEYTSVPLSTSNILVQYVDTIRVTGTDTVYSIPFELPLAWCYTTASVTYNGTVDTLTASEPAYNYAFPFQVHVTDGTTDSIHVYCEPLWSSYPHCVAYGFASPSWSATWGGNSACVDSGVAVGNGTETVCRLVTLPVCGKLMLYGTEENATDTCALVKVSTPGK